MSGELPPCPCVSGYFPELDPELYPMPKPLGIDVPNRNPDRFSSGTRPNGHRSEYGWKHNRP
jgi:hypothetical protein